MNAPQIITRCDPFGHWSAHFAGQPWLSFGGDSPHVATLRLLTANPEGPQHIVAATERPDHVAFELA